MGGSEHYYGEGPVSLGKPTAGIGVDVGDVWDEFMHYLYLPVRIPAMDDPAVAFPQYGLPERLEFLDDAIAVATADAAQTAEHLRDPYVYITARRGFATPGNPLNRPGWHCDDFGGTDLNYIWTDRYPTRLLRSTYPLAMPEDDAESMVTMASYEEQFEAQGIDGWTNRKGKVWIEEVPLNHLIRLSPYVIHDTPVIPAPGGMRSFFKISVSTHRYNLRGNSHNHLLDYDWPMYDRAAIRNQPGGNGDYYEEKAP